MLHKISLSRIKKNIKKRYIFDLLLPYYHLFYSNLSKLKKHEHQSQSLNQMNLDIILKLTDTDIY